MNQGPRKPLGRTRADDADARGEHIYPDQKRQGKSTVEEDALERNHYAAGADGTQMVPEPKGAALPEEES